MGQYRLRCCFFVRVCYSVYLLLSGHRCSTAAQYVVLYDDTHASDQVIGWFDNGSPFTIFAGNARIISSTSGENSVDFVSYARRSK